MNGIDDLFEQTHSIYRLFPIGSRINYRFRARLVFYGSFESFFFLWPSAMHLRACALRGLL